MPVHECTKSHAQLHARIEELEAQLAEAQETLRAIREGEVDAVIVSGARGEQVYALVGTESIYRLIVETMKEAALTVTFDGTILYCNGQFGELVERPVEQIIGRPLDEFTAPENRAAVQSLLARGQRQPVRQRLVFRNAEGRPVPAHVASNLLNQPDDLSICIVATDLTELENSTDLIQQLRRQQDQLEGAAEELRRSNKDLEQFAYIASHDLQGPLRLVSGYADLLKEEAAAKLTPQERFYVDTMADSTQRMGRLIQDLLAYSRVGSHGKAPQRTDMEQVLQTVLTDLGTAIKECAAVVTHDPLATVWADETQMKQLLTNLIGNAIKFRKKEEPPRVHVKVERQAGFWSFAVEDNGIGIDPKFHDRIFQVFQRLHSEEEYPGTGIGLAICKKIVERHGGQMCLDSQLGRGTTFYFTIPDREDQPA